MIIINRFKNEFIVYIYIHIQYQRTQGTRQRTHAQTQIHMLTGF